MEKLTYKEFERLAGNLGYQLFFEGEEVNLVKHNYYVIVSVSTRHVGIMNTYTSVFSVIDEDEMVEIGELCWRLAVTPLGDREEQKKYYLRLKPQFDYLKRYSPSYLIRDSVRVDDMCVSNIAKMAFTDAQIKDMSKTYDISLFEKVEVEDE